LVLFHSNGKVNAVPVQGSSYRSHRPKYTGRKQSNPKRVPIGRVLLILGVLYWAYHHYLGGSTAASSSSAPSKPPAEALLPKPVAPKSQVYKNFLLKDSSRQVSLYVTNALIPDTVQSLDSIAQTIIYAEALQQSIAETTIRLDFFYKKNTPIPYKFRRMIDSISIVYTREYYTALVPILDRIDTLYYWKSSDGCIWGKQCLQSPLQGAAISVDSTFDFSGRESLLYYDLFIGLGESPVRAILPGKIVQLQRDSTNQMVRVYHGRLLFAKYSGLVQVPDSLQEGAWVAQGQVLGRLQARDSAGFYLQILQNGRFKRYSDVLATHTAKGEGL
jgi:hypothetical protein